MNFIRCVTGVGWGDGAASLKYIQYEYCSSSTIEAALWGCGIWASSKICDRDAGRNTGSSFESVPGGSENIASVGTSSRGRRKCPRVPVGDSC